MQVREIMDPPLSLFKEPTVVKIHEVNVEQI